MHRRVVEHVQIVVMKSVQYLVNIGVILVGEEVGGLVSVCENIAFWLLLSVGLSSILAIVVL